MELISVTAGDGPAEAHVARPSSGSGPGVLHFIDAIGVRPQIASMAERIASWGYVVLSPNVLYRNGSVEDVRPHVDLRAEGARDAFFAQAMPRVRGLFAQDLSTDLDAYRDALRGLDGVSDGPIGAVGYCMGARLATLFACRHPQDVAAAAGFHGGGLATDDPGSPHRQLSTARAEFVYGHADNDGSMPPEAVATLGEALASAGLTASNEIYPDAPHGYTMADTSMYQEAGAERAFSELEALFARTLR
ncbi:dienelactone hydrolase family protein [Williamsia deligens]|uniref:Dienelactone hydrolase family protein n=1 Tax=Williamsia deligens TaxID=321325 RepID=A0ABW3GFN8_9NOCA|nr:dienelactone hydrolase family protein [Williamsia deligens]MCP2195155.1 carboxymethylenebutenolidase [Williamsia deligens]